MTAFYNEIDPFACDALEALMADGLIAPGVVDRRSIKEINPDDLEGFTQCHFFAGAGLWSVAARLAGWPDDLPLWTGSCPCQPFSAAGKRKGADDPRHLWPDLHRLVRARRPARIVGEQVAGKTGYAWLDGVCSDLEAEGYACRAVDIPACSVDAPHERNRLAWVGRRAMGDADGDGCGDAAISYRPGQTVPLAHRADGGGRRLADAESRGGGTGLREIGAQRHRTLAADGDGRDVVLADAEGIDRGGNLPLGRPEGRAAARRADAGGGPVADADVALVQGFPPARQLPLVQSDARIVEGLTDGPDRVVGDAVGAGREGLGGHVAGGRVSGRGSDSDTGPREKPEAHRSVAAANAGRNGSWWADAEWILCHDGKARRTQSDICMLVDGMVGRNHLWRLAGNSIAPVLFAEVLAALAETEGLY